MATDGFPGQMPRDTQQDRAAYLQPPRPLQPNARPTLRSDLKPLATVID